MVQLKKAPRPVKVVWRDSQVGPEGWVEVQHLEKDKQALQITSYGWLMLKGRHHLVVAMSYSKAQDGYEQCQGQLLIPVSAVVSMTYLKRVSVGTLKG